MNTIKLALCALVALSSSLAFAAGIDIQQSPTDFFVPTDAQKGTFPYYRYSNNSANDWGWTHGGIDTTAAAFANLNISAYDVDYDGTADGENDEIFAYDTDTAAWISLGFLAGGSDIWSYTNFALNLATFSNEIAAGLQVKIDIDTTHNYDWWAVSLAKSVLSVDDSRIPPPTPGVPDSTSSLLLCVTGLACLGLFRRKLV